MYLSCSGDLDHTELFKRKSLALIQTLHQQVEEGEDLQTATEEMLRKQQKWKPIKAVCTNFPTNNSWREFLKFTIYIIDESKTVSNTSICRIRTKFISPTGVCSHWFAYHCAYRSLNFSTETNCKLQYNTKPPIIFELWEPSVSDIAAIQTSLAFDVIPTQAFIFELCEKIRTALGTCKPLHFVCPTLQDFYDYAPKDYDEFENNDSY